MRSGGNVQIRICWQGHATQQFCVPHTYHNFKPAVRRHGFPCTSALDCKNRAFLKELLSSAMRQRRHCHASPAVQLWDFYDSEVTKPLEAGSFLPVTSFPELCSAQAKQPQREEL